VAAGKVHIVGIGDDGVDGMTAQARRLIEAADVLLGPESCAPLLPAALASRLQASVSLEDLVERIEAAGPRQVVVLASGDPLFYGTARYVCGKLGKDRFEVVPHVSSMQLAFARVKESWEEAFLANLSGQSIERVIDKVRTSDTAGLFTSEQWPPAAVARALLEEGVDSFQAYVCENLGSPDERVTPGRSARGCSATPTGRFSSPVRSGACSRRRRCGRWRWPNWDSNPTASPGTWAPAAARWASRRRGSRGTAACTRSRWIRTTTG
jgi:precorrin-6Y C5,15-methyltransferase (decarboxylating)